MSSVELGDGVEATPVSYLLEMSPAWVRMATCRALYFEVQYSERIYGKCRRLGSEGTLLAKNVYLTEILRNLPLQQCCQMVLTV